MSNRLSGSAASGFPFQNLKSGFIVSLIALPLCLGIALASGFPPIAGLLTAIVGGLVVTPLGSARLTIKGPAAGLIVIAIGCVTELGQGDPVVGYQRTLAVGAVAAVIQIVFARLRLATAGVALSPSVVHGMLAAIGVIIVAKQSHVLLGVTPVGREPLELLAELPHSLMQLNPELALIGGVSLLILFGWSALPSTWATRVPAPLVVLLAAVPLGFHFGMDHEHAYRLWGATHEVGPRALVTLPGSIRDAIVFPDFSQITSLASLRYIATFALVGSIESTLTVLAVDSLDPQRRSSDPNRDLLAVGIGNLVCAMIGGLPMISEVVRSKANIDAGARSQVSNFVHGGLLLVAAALFPGVLHTIPLAALAAMLVYTGTRLASPTVFIHARRIGPDQLLLFTATFVVTLATDLLIGVATGIGLEVVLHWLRGASPAMLVGTRIERTEGVGELRLTLRGAAAFPGLLKLRHALSNLETGVERVVVDVTHVGLVDHTFLSRLESISAERPDVSVVVEGLERLASASAHPHATRHRIGGRQRA